MWYQNNDALPLQRMFVRCFAPLTRWLEEAVNASWGSALAAVRTTSQRRWWCSMRALLLLLLLGLLLMLLLLGLLLLLHSTTGEHDAGLGSSRSRSEEAANGAPPQPHINVTVCLIVLWSRHLTRHWVPRQLLAVKRHTQLQQRARDDARDIHWHTNNSSVARMAVAVWRI